MYMHTHAHACMQTHTHTHKHTHAHVSAHTYAHAHTLNQPIANTEEKSGSSSSGEGGMAKFAILYCLQTFHDWNENTKDTTKSPYCVILWLPSSLWCGHHGKQIPLHPSHDMVQQRSPDPQAPILTATHSWDTIAVLS